MTQPAAHLRQKQCSHFVPIDVFRCSWRVAMTVSWQDGGNRRSTGNCNWVQSLARRISIQTDHSSSSDPSTDTWYQSTERPDWTERLFLLETQLSPRSGLTQSENFSLSLREQESCSFTIFPNPAKVSGNPHGSIVSLPRFWTASTGATTAALSSLNHSIQAVSSKGLRSDDTTSN